MQLATVTEQILMSLELYNDMRKYTTQTKGRVKVNTMAEKQGLHINILTHGSFFNIRRVALFL